MATLTTSITVAITTYMMVAITSFTTLVVTTSEQVGMTAQKRVTETEKMTFFARGHRDRKKRPGVDFFFKATLAGLTNLRNQEHF
jgi:hypothetical protein